MKARLENHGSLYLIRCLDTSAKAWFKEHTGDDAQWLGEALAVEPRYVDDILDGFQCELGEVTE